MKKAAVYIETHGCQMNVADTERARGVLLDADYHLVGTADEADVVILNTCSVRERAELKVSNRIGQIRHFRTREQPLIGVMGCVAQLEGESLFNRKSKIDFVAGTRATNRLPKLIAEALERQEERVIDLGERQPGENWDVRAELRHDARIAFVPIIEGCNKFCSYCIVPYSRGREKSRAAAEIIAEVESLRDAGYKEIHLIGQNVNSYRPPNENGLEGVSGATPFARLLRAVAKTEVARIKFNTSFPRDFHADIVAAIDEYENLCNWVHLPVQSGSDRVLKSMRRGYKLSDYQMRIDALHQSAREIAITSDIIVGYPGETEADFQLTLDLLDYCQYSGLYIFKYSQRRGTPAAKLDDDVSEKVKAARFEALEQKQKSIQSEIYNKFVGKRVEVLIERQSARSETEYTGHTACHKVVNLEASANLTGSFVQAEITAAKPHSLYGKLV